MLNFKPPKGVKLHKDQIKFLENVEEIANSCFGRMKEFYPFHNTWDAHSKNVLESIKGIVSKSKLTFTKDEWTVLIASCILHDIGKVLPFLHPSFKPDEPKPLFFASELLEEGHHIISFLFISSLINDKFLEYLKKDKEFYKFYDKYVKNKSRESRKKLLEKIKEVGSPVERGHVLEISDNDIKAKCTKIIQQIESAHPGWNQYLHCVAWISLLHKQINTKLLQTFSEDLCKKRIFDPDHSFWSNPEKLDTLFKEKKDQNIEDIDKWLLEEKKDKENHKNRFNVLLALFNFGDKLDISEERLQGQQFYIAILLDDIGLPRTSNKFPHPDAMARWFQYIFTKKPRIEYEDKKTDEKEPEKNENSQNETIGNIKVVIPYRYPESLSEEFPFFRYQAEKDFEDLSILSVLEKAIQEEQCNEDFSLTIRREEKPKQFRGLQNRNERLLYCLHKTCSLIKGIKKTDAKSLTNYLDNLDIPIGANEFFPCREKKPQPWKNCALLELVINAFEEDARASYPDWQKYAPRRPGKLKLHQIICENKGASNDNETKVLKYLEKITGKDVMLDLSPRARDGFDSWKKKVAIERKSIDLKGKLFFPFAGRPRRIPVSMDVAYLLNLFRHLESEPLNVEDITNITGLDRGRILMYCGRLEHEGFILLDSQGETYTFNNDKYREVEKILKPFDYRRAELVAKVRDIERFGRPLALCSDHNETTLATNIEGLDRVLAPFEKEKSKIGLPLRKSILILGPPGSGKTTLALEIVRNVRLKRFPAETALYLTFEEDIQRLFENFKDFGWTRSDMYACVRSLSTLQRKAYLENPDQFLKGFLGILDEFSPDLVALDNLGYLLQLVPPEASREILNRLIRVLTVRGITSLLVGEHITEGISFEAYDVDGVIHLGYEGGKRWLEITKMRGCEFGSGRHPFRIGKKRKSSPQDNASEKSCIQVFSNIQMYIAKEQRDDDDNNGNKKDDTEKQILSSGIKGLDDLLPIYSETAEKKSGFEQGEVILVLGSPGAGKTLLGLHFLKEGWGKNKENKEKSKKERVLWISFESDLNGIKLATRSFSEDAGFKGLIEDMDSKTEVNTRFQFFTPAQLDPDELVNYLFEECYEKGGLHRIVLDSVTDLEQIFNIDIKFKVFMTSLVQLLRKKGITTMFLYRTKEFFGKTEDIGRVLSSVVDTIICFKVLELQNEVHKGLFLLKVRGREHRSKLLSVTFDEKQGMIVSDRGWTMSGLISGETGEIREPRVFVKLFFENQNEILLNSLIVHEYNRRFKGVKTRFVQVRKPHIYTEFWSFRGSSGAGHANIRVVSLCDYWAVPFDKQNKLYNLWKYVSTETRQLVRRDEFWRRCASYSYKDHTFKIFAVPNYIDVGVLAFHEDIKNLKEFWDFVDLDEPADVEDARMKLSRLTWNQLDPREQKENNKISKLKEALSNKSKGENNKFPKYLFSMPGLSDTPTFVSFFLEILWSFGGAIFDYRWVFDDYAKYCTGFLYNPNNNLEWPRLFKPPRETTPHLNFVGEILLLIPERVLDRTIQETKKKKPNLIADICQHGDILLDQLLEHEGRGLSGFKKAPAVKDIDSPLEIFKKKENGEDTTKLICEFIGDLIEELKSNNIWKGQTSLESAAQKAKEIVEKVIRSKNKQNKEDLLLILYNVLSRIVTGRERSESLLEWLTAPSKNKEKLSDKLERLIRIDPENAYALDTIRFLVALVKSGLTPNPLRGDLTDQAYLARKWCGDVAPSYKIESLKDIAETLDLYSPAEAYKIYERMKADKTYQSDDKGKDTSTPYHITPLPSYERKKGTNGQSEKWSYSVLGLWQLGITSPAVSPEIGWIFIDALTEDKFVEMRAKLGLGLPAKGEAYSRAAICEAQPEIFGRFNNDGELVKDGEGIVQFYKLATMDKPQKENLKEGKDKKEKVERYRRERAMTPYYYKLEEILGREFKRFFEPSFFNTHFMNDKEDKENKENRNKLIKKVLERIKNRIKNFLISELRKSI
jgi:circadian clock protein KaiC